MITTLEELEEVMALYRRLLKDETIPEILRSYQLPEEKIKSILFSIMAGNNEWYFYVFRRDGKIVGFFAGTVILEYLLGIISAQEVVGWVAPEYRNPSTIKEGIKVIEGFEDWARSRGCVRVRFNSYGNYIPQLEMLGYEQSTVVLQKRLS